MIVRNILRVFAAWLIALLIAGIACAADPILPNLHLTPGMYRKDLSADQISKTKWGLDKRHVTESMKKQVFAEYGVSLSRRSEFEVDHLISRELGGTDDSKKEITLEEARKAVTHDWRKAYKKYFGEPIAAPVTTAKKKR